MDLDKLPEPQMVLLVYGTNDWKFEGDYRPHLEAMLAALEARCPLAWETKVLLDLAAEGHVDCALRLHGGTNSVNDLLMTRYVTEGAGGAVQQLAVRCSAL